MKSYKLIRLEQKRRLEQTDEEEQSTEELKFFHPHKMRIYRKPVRYDQKMTEKYFVHNIINE